MTDTYDDQAAFTFQTYEGLDPEFIEHERDDYKDTAWCWCLHVRVPREYGTGDDAAEHFFQHLMVLFTDKSIFLRAEGSNDPDGPRTPSIPAAIGGDSFTEWVEPWQPGHDRALHIYIGAPDSDMATVLACGFMYLTGLTTADVALSTGGDFAEQITLPTRPEESV